MSASPTTAARHPLGSAQAAAAPSLSLGNDPTTTTTTTPPPSAARLALTGLALGLLLAALAAACAVLLSAALFGYPGGLA